MSQTAIVDPNNLSQEVKDLYTITNNTFIREEKEDARDRLQVEVGDSKQTEFYPQIKLLRWDNEVNFSARLLEDDDDDPLVAASGSVILWERAKKTARLYQLEPSKEHPEGGYEFEITLFEKPVSNIITFSIRAKGLDFYYQPALTEEEILEGIIRPNHVVGSYAVYYKDAPLNIEDGKEYKTGKAFHLYRPKIEDANKEWCWGDLNIDVENQLMNVTIPQSFLDTAVYPVTHAAGATFGYTTIGGTQYYFYGYQIFGQKGIPADATGKATKISAYAIMSGGSDPGKHAALYDNSSFPAKLVETTVTTDYSGTATWFDMPFSSPYTISNTTYWIAIQPYYNGTRTGYFYYDNTGTTSALVQNESSNTFPAALSPPAQNRLFSFYTTYSVTNIKTVLGLAEGSVKTMLGLARASVKTWDGLA